MTGDTRIRVIIRNVVCLLGAENISQWTDENAAAVQGDPAQTSVLAAFLDNPSRASCLYAVKMGNEGCRISFLASTDDIAKWRDVVVVFYDTMAPDDSDGITNGIVCRRLLQSVGHDLYTAIHTMYKPLLTNFATGDDIIDASIHSLLADLERGLRANLRRFGAAEREGRSAQVGVFTVTDEYEFWADRASDRHSDRDTVTVARWVCSVLEPLSRKYAEVDELDAEGALEQIEVTQDSLDYLWRQEEFPDGPDRNLHRFPQNRMERLLCVLTIQWIRWARVRAEAVASWEAHVSTAGENLRGVETVLDEWCRSAEDLTQRYWAGEWNTSTAEHGQKDSKDSCDTEHLGATLETAKALSQRFAHVREIRRFIHGMENLLSPAEQETYGVCNLFDIFRSLDVGAVGKLGQHAWASADQVFEERVSRTYDIIADRLSAELTADASDSPGPLNGTPSHVPLLRQLEPFRKHSALLKHPHIAKRAHTVVQRAVSLLNECLELARADVHSAPSPAAISRRVSPTELPIIHDDARGLVHGRELAGSVRLLARAILPNESAASIVAAATDVEAEANDSLEALFQAWCRAAETAIQTFPTPVSSANGKPSSTGESRAQESLLRIDPDDGRLLVGMDTRRERLLSEVRHLSSLGMRFPPAILRAAAQARQLHHQELALRQVAALYNTIDEKIVPAQRAMLLVPALDFERAVHRQAKAPAAGPHTDAATYVAALQKAAATLLAETKKLRRVHETAMSEILSAANRDILGEVGVWRDTMKKIRMAVLQLEAEGYSETSAWRAHVDAQVAKVVHTQLDCLLPSLHTRLSTKRTKTKAANGIILFDPPLEEIRSGMHQEVRNVVGALARLRGVGESGEQFFVKALQAHSEALGSCSRLLGEMVHGARDGMSVFGDWLQGCDFDPEEYVKTSIASVLQWERALRLLRGRQRDAERLPEQVRSGLIIIDTTHVRQAVIDGIRRLRGRVAVILAQKVSTGTEGVRSFAAEALARLASQPASASEMAAREAECRSLTRDQKAKLRELRSHSDEIRVLRAASSGLSLGDQLDVDQLDRLTEDAAALLDELGLRLSAYSELIADQRETLREDTARRARTHEERVREVRERWSMSSAAHSAGSRDKEGAVGVLTELREWADEAELLVKESKALADECEAFGVSFSASPDVAELQESVHATQASWQVLADFEGELAEWREQPWARARAKLHELDDFIRGWRGRGKDVASRTVVAALERTLERISSVIPTLRLCDGSAFTAEHWAALFGLLHLPRSRTPSDVTLGEFLEHAQDIQNAAAEIAALHARARGELVVREAIEEVAAWAAQRELSFVEHAGVRRRTPLVNDWDDLAAEIGDHMGLLASVHDSRYFELYADDAALWEAKLQNLSAAHSAIAAIQRKWIYLEPILSRGALPAQQARFDRADTGFADLVENLRRDPRASRLANIGASLGPVEEMANLLDICQRALAVFLEEKRNSFPRFYFLGDEDMLEILGRSRELAVVQPHLGKLFQGISQIEISDVRINTKESVETEDAQSISGNDSAGTIVGIRSAEGETVALVRAVAPDGDVDSWLGVLDKEAAHTLKSAIRRAVADLASSEASDTHGELERLAYDYPGQVGEVTLALRWTTMFERAIRGRGSAVQGRTMENAAAHIRSELHALTTLRPEDPVVRLRVKNLVLDVIHGRDVASVLQGAGEALTEAAWEWQRQLRYYQPEEEGGGIRVAMCDASLPYGFEYQGTPSKLVHTPLTDKCFLALTQGLHFGFGGNPYGPAGTGKTESVKALGRALGRQVLVFNCDEGLDYRAMGRIFAGLARVGAWGCFDEFNRLEPQVLSAVSQQIQVLQAGLSAGAPAIELLGRATTLSASAGVFVTMNPAGKGYGGRSKLPDNLKQLFRPVAMSQPDMDLIAEVVLLSEGFQHASALGRRLAFLFRCAPRLLSAQQHYDWGLRAMKSVVRFSGELLQRRSEGISKENKVAADGADDVRREEVEQELVVQAARANTLSKLTVEDARRFERLVEDVFQIKRLPPVDYGSIGDAVATAFGTLGLHASPVHVERALQLWELMQQRIGVVLVGAPGTGKSTALRVLEHALVQRGTQVHVVRMNPKACARTKLLGHLDIDTRIWYDGILTKAARQVTRIARNELLWIVCDGDIDPEWIESLNSVLDDNRLLTLPNGERIQFSSNVNFVFETDDLSFASPATVSRMGVLYLTEGTRDATSVVEGPVRSWLSSTQHATSDATKRPARQQVTTAASDALLGADEKGTEYDEGQSAVKGALGESCAAGAVPRAWSDSDVVEILREALRHAGTRRSVVPTTTLGLVRNVLPHLAGCESREEIRSAVALSLSAVFDSADAAAIAYGILGAESGVDPMRAHMYTWSTVNDAFEPFHPSDLDDVHSFPSTSVAEDAAPPNGSDSTGDSLVLTAGIMRILAIAKPWIQARNPIAIVGDRGSGKSLLVRHLFKQHRRVTLVEVECNAETRASDILSRLQAATAVVATSQGRMLRPQNADAVVLYVRNIHIPRTDRYGTVECAALVSQMVQHGGFYDDDMLWTGLDRIQLVCSLTPATGDERVSLRARFFASMRVVYLDHPEQSELVRIYKSVASRVLDSPSDNAARVAHCAVALLSRARNLFSPSIEPHYRLSLRQLTDCVQGLSYYSDTDESHIALCLLNEMNRALRDRLVSVEHRRQFAGMLRAALDDAGLVLEENPELVPANRDDSWNPASPHFSDKSMFAAISEYGNLSLCSASDLHSRTIDRARVRVERDVLTTPVLLPPAALDGFAAVERVLLRPCGHVILCGRPGDGRHEVLELFAAAHGTEIRTATIGTVTGGAAGHERGPGGDGRRAGAGGPTDARGAGSSACTRQVLADLRASVLAAGCEGSRVVFMIEEHHMRAGGLLVLDALATAVSNAASTDIVTEDELEGAAAPHREAMLADFHSWKQQYRDMQDESGVDSGRETMSSVGREARRLSHIIAAKLESTASASSSSELRRAFTYRVVRNFHVALALDTQTRSLDKLCQSHPAIVSRATLTWWQPWSSSDLEMSALTALVAHKPLSGANATAQERELAAAKTDGLSDSDSRAQPHRESSDSHEEHRSSVKALVDIHMDCCADDPCAWSSLSFMQLLTTYQTIVSSRQASIEKDRRRLHGGLARLAEAAQTVDEMSQSAALKREELAVQQHEADEALLQIQRSMEEASESKRRAEGLRHQMQQQETELSSRKDRIEMELEDIRPAMEQAKREVGQIRNENLTEIRSLKMPPEPIRDVLEGVLKLLGNDDTSWMSMKRFLGQRGVKDMIIRFDPRRIRPDHREAVERLLAAAGRSFEPSVITRASVAAAPLAAWVKATLRYATVLERLSPLENELHKLQEELDIARAAVEENERVLAELDGKVASLREEFRLKTARAETLRADVERTEETVCKASSLLEALGAERARWERRVAELDAAFAAAPRSAVLAAAFSTYLARAPEEHRRKKLQRWTEQVYEGTPEAFEYAQTVATERERLAWRAGGLPADQLSLENAAVLVKTLSPLGVQAVPLVVDPSGAASHWFESLMAGHSSGAEVVSALDPRLGTAAERAARFGRALLVRDVAEHDVPPLLVPLLRREFRRSGARTVVRIADKEVDVADGLRIVLFAKSSSVAMPADVAPFLSEVNFSVTQSGLESQLLGLVLDVLRPELGQQKSELLRREEDMRMQLLQLEDRILEELTESQVSLLDNDALIESLNSAKSQTASIEKALADAHEVERSLAQETAAYRPLAEQGSHLYFLLQRLVYLRQSYRFGLASFVSLFERSVRDPDARGEPNAIQGNVLSRVVRAALLCLSKSDRRAFLLLLMYEMQLCPIEPHEWKHFADGSVRAVQGASAAENASPYELLSRSAGATLPTTSSGAQTASIPSWIPEERRGALKNLLAQVPVIHSRARLDDAATWGSWMSSPMAERALPIEELSAFQKLLLVLTLRPDRSHAALTRFIVEGLPPCVQTSPKVDFGVLAREEMAGGKTPALLFVGPGADPSIELEEIGARTVGPSRYRQLAMGQGQEEAALRLLLDASKQGYWLCLQNLHLALAALPRIVQTLRTLSPHTDFRLWLTTEPNDALPESLIEDACKVSFEAPPGIRENLLRSISSWSNEAIDSACALQRKLMYSAALLHAVAQERRSYVPQGWSKAYEFNVADLRAALMIMQSRVTSDSFSDWQTLYGLFDNAVYGGRVDSTFDARLLRALMESVISPSFVRGERVGSARALPAPPQQASLADIQHHVETNISSEETTEMLSLPRNSHAVRQEREVRALRQTLKSLSAAPTAQAAQARLIWLPVIEELAKRWNELRSSWKANQRVPTGSQTLQANRVSGEHGAEQPLVSFARDDFELGQRIVARIEADVDGILGALREARALDPTLLQCAEAIGSGKVPSRWTKIWDLSFNSPFSYVDAVARSFAGTHERLVEFAHLILPRKEWCAAHLHLVQAQRDVFSIALDSTFRPDAFLTALQQEASRYYDSSMSDLVLTTSLDPGSSARGAARVSGLSLQGALIRDGALAELDSLSPMLTPIPPLQLAYVPKSRAERATSAPSHQAPLYLSSDRSNLLCVIQLPSSGDSLRWTLLGVAAVVHSV